MEESTIQQNQPQENPFQAAGTQKNTFMAIIAYIIFFVPLLTEAKKDPFVKYHIKQGLLLFIGWIAVSIIDYILPYYGWIIVRLLNLALFILMVVGIMSAAKGEQKPLPVIGKIGEQFKF